ncbi:hypothetical protein [Candidatus Halobonum tyrrellensis]|uniref:Uncharacterized protein n=1 Tax=Candidatus Halobonum tyrrellensis G22 TaxID=1324957 RepID=V4HBA0_9EURY|nr:hypothetical protein [Candidatus Halobonum tyrrellensis]ESP87298.1 hypothetical protein K933_14468 [Candidatus Halobonum tyrrellensis G22]
MVDIDSETLFTVAAAAVATVAAVIFVLSVDFGHSPVSEVALAAAFLAGVFALTQRTDDRQSAVLGYGVVVVVSVALFFDVVNTFDVGDLPTVVGLLCIAALLFWLRTRLDERSRFTTGTRARNVFAVVAALAAVVVVVDVATGGLAYELRPASQVEVPDAQRDRVRVATVTASNPTPLPERVDPPRYEACAAGNWSAFEPPTEPDGRRRAVRATLDVQAGYDEYVLGFGAKTYPVELYLDGANLTGETFPVRTTADCPDEETGSPYVAVFTAPDDAYGGPLTVTA